MKVPNERKKKKTGTCANEKLYEGKKFGLENKEIKESENK